MTDRQPAPEPGVIEVQSTHFSRREDREAASLPVAVNATPMAMLMAAVQRGHMEPGTLKEMMELAERWEANEARKAYNKALAGFKSEAVEIIKKKRVFFTNKANVVTDYKHAELSDVVEALGPPLSKHGFAWGWKTKQEKGWIEVTCTLTHELGHSESVTLGAPPDDTGGKNSVQQIVSTVTYLERHTLKAVAGVSEKGDDKLDGDAGKKGANGKKGMPEDERAKWEKEIKAGKNPEDAKATWREAHKAAVEYADRETAEHLKKVLLDHGEFLQGVTQRERSGS